MKTKIAALLGVFFAICAFSINNLFSAPWADEWAVFFQGCIYALESGLITFGVTYVTLYAWEHLFPSHYKKSMQKLSSKIEGVSNSIFDE